MTHWKSAIQLKILPLIFSYFDVFSSNYMYLKTNFIHGMERVFVNA